MTSRPNFFVGIRLSSDSLASKFSTIQDKIIERAPKLHKCRMNVKKLHLTCFVLTLNSEDHIKAASDCLLNFQSYLSDIFAVASKEVSFNDINSFSTKVLFCPPVESETLSLLTEITKQLQQQFINAGLMDCKIHHSLEKWTPHATILKTSYDRRNGRKLRIEPSHYEGCEAYLNGADIVSSIAEVCSDIDSTVPGVEPSAVHTAAIDTATNSTTTDTATTTGGGITVPLTTIDLLSMQEMQDDGYYRSYAHIHF